MDRKSQISDLRSQIADGGKWVYLGWIVVFGWLWVVGLFYREHVLYSSLDRIDIVLEPGADGRKRFVQTDHRTKEEILGEPELSAMFGLVRMMMPRRMVEEGEMLPEVGYMPAHGLPEFLLKVIQSAGGHLVMSEGVTVPALKSKPLGLEGVIAAVFSHMAGAVSKEIGVMQTVAGLEQAESVLAYAARNGKEEDEAAYWGAVVKLGALGGEIVRKANGGTWKFTREGTLPFCLMTTFNGRELTVNPLGKAVKRIAQGRDESVAGMVKMLTGPVKVMDWRKM
jgi:hypothetical protein